MISSVGFLDTRRLKADAKYRIKMLVHLSTVSTMPMMISIRLLSSSVDYLRTRCQGACQSKIAMKAIQGVRHQDRRVSHLWHPCPQWNAYLTFPPLPTPLQMVSVRLSNQSPAHFRRPLNLLSPSPRLCRLCSHMPCSPSLNASLPLLPTPRSPCPRPSNMLVTYFSLLNILHTM